LSTVPLAAAEEKPEVHRPDEQAWSLLNAGAESTNAETRRIAIGALGIIVKNQRATAIAENGLSDDNADVRMAAATALGQMDAHTSIPKLLSALDDKEPAVVLAAAQSLIRLKNERGYDIYYEVLTGGRKASKSSVAKQIETLKNPKKLAELGFEEGIGFVPFGGMGLDTLRVLRGDSNTAIRAAAAKVLIHDSDPDAAKALTEAVTDKSWHVRVAAVDAIAERGDPKLLAPVETAMQDDKDAVRYSAAAAVVHLLDVERSHLSKSRKSKVNRALVKPSPKESQQAISR
jgi:HEAT repeat protein